MLCLRDEAAVSGLPDGAIRNLLMERIAAMTEGEPFDAEVNGYFVLVEPGDSLALVEAAAGFPILRNPVSGAPYGEPAFRPGWEWLASSPELYELGFVPSDGDYAVIVLVPNLDGIDPVLLAVCREFAEPSWEGE